MSVRRWAVGCTLFQILTGYRRLPYVTDEQIQDLPPPGPDRYSALANLIAQAPGFLWPDRLKGLYDKE